jgi:hypothetical protein
MCTYVCASMCACLHVCMCACVHMCMVVRVHVCMCARSKHVCTCVFVNVYVCVCTCVCVFMCACIYVCMCLCVHVFMCACVYVCMCMCAIFPLFLSLSWCKWWWLVLNPQPLDDEASVSTPTPPLPATLPLFFFSAALKSITELNFFRVQHRSQEVIEGR